MRKNVLLLFGCLAMCVSCGKAPRLPDGTITILYGEPAQPQQEPLPSDLQQQEQHTPDASSTPESSPETAAQPEPTPPDNATPPEPTKPDTPAVCQAGQRRCKDSSSYELCTNGQWSPAQACGSDQVCKDDGQCQTVASSDGWIGDPCTSDTSCQFADGYCITDVSYPGGLCTQACSKLCPDKAGKPTTFCVDLQGKGKSTAGCISRCDYTIYPQGGCRTGYHCAERTRYNDTARTLVCLPGKAPPLSGCYQQLQQLGLKFQKVAPPNDSATFDSSCTQKTKPCPTVEPLTLYSPIHGVEWVYYNTSSSGQKLGRLVSCQLALAISKFSKYLLTKNITKAEHLGTYNCRAIRLGGGRISCSLSNHSFGNAIDLSAFWDANGKEYNLYKHWDHSTTWTRNGQVGCWSSTFKSPEAKMLYEIGCDMWRQKIFMGVLTPNYNSAHDNHFHVETSGSSRIYKLPIHHIGVNHQH